MTKYTQKEAWEMMEEGSKNSCEHQGLLQRAKILLENDTTIWPEELDDELESMISELGNEVDEQPPIKRDDMKIDFVCGCEIDMNVWNQCPTHAAAPSMDDAIAVSIDILKRAKSLDDALNALPFLEDAKALVAAKRKDNG